MPVWKSVVSGGDPVDGQASRLPEMKAHLGSMVLDVPEIVQMELAPFLGNQIILVDPDSRLSQLGVLPLISTDRYFFFDSRSDASLNRQMSMAELTNSWLDQVTDTHDFRYPMVWLEPDNTQKAAALCNTLKHNGARRLVAVNFGVGGNPIFAFGGMP